MRRRKTKLCADELVAECAAFVRGGYAPYLARRRRPVPAWAWTNVLAHATEPELEELARAPGCYAPASGRWALACGYVVRDVLDLAERYGPLPDLQAGVLIPLELELATRGDVEDWSPLPWVTAVTTALHDHRRRCERQARSRSTRTGGE